MSQPVPACSVKAAIADQYAQLSGALQAAADYVAENRFDVATRSLRSIASDCGLSPTSFSRMARAIGYQDYEQLRDRAREELADQSSHFSNKAQQLHSDTKQPLLPRQVKACVHNIEALVSNNLNSELESAVETLCRAKRVVIVGALGSAAFADYFAYLTSWFDGRWTVAGRNGTTLASTLMRLSHNDAVIVISKAPYAKRAIVATEIAAESGASIIAITDSHAFPGLKHAAHPFIQQSESPQFFSSYAATLVLIETMVGMLVAKSGPHAIDEIEAVVQQNNRLDEFSSQ